MNCVNYGAVTGTGAIGGVAGRAETGSWIAHCYWKRTVSAPFDVPAFGINNNAGMTMECFSFSDAPGTLSGSVYISGTATFNLAEALKAGMFDGRDTLDIPLRGWTRGSATAYPALITDCWSDPGNFVTNWFDEDASDFTIGSAAELAGLAVLVNGGVSFADKRITLTADIALDAHEWDPIGYLSDGVNPERYFNGLLFDGNGKTISGLYVDDDERRAGGLFGVARDGTILNLGLTDADVVASEEAGILCGHLGKNTIANSFCRGRVRGACAGGIVGAVEGTLMNCWSDARVDGFVSGGLAGRLADPNAFMISGFWMQNGRNYHDLSAVGDYGEAEEANAAECYSFSEPPGQLAVPGEDDPLTLSEALNEVSEGMDGYLGLRWYGWTRGTRWDYPVPTARIRVDGELIQETLSDDFTAGLTLSEVAGGVAIYTDAHPETTAASFGSLMQEADIMGFTFPELIAGNAILEFSPSLRTTSFNPDAWPLIVTFSVANGIDATAVQAMDRLETCWGWSSEILILQMDAPGGEGTLVWPDEVYFGADGTAEAEFIPEVYSDKVFFKLLIVPATY